MFAAQPLTDLGQVQQRFDRWRTVYNTERPHEALDMAVPAERYQPSRRVMPETVPEVDYDSDDIVRRVGTTKSYITFKGRLWGVPRAFRGERVAIRPSTKDGLYGVYFGANKIAIIDLTA